MTDHYADGTCRWWHLSRPPPERAAVPSDTRVLEVIIARLSAARQS